MVVVDVEADDGEMALRFVSVTCRPPAIDVVGTVQYVDNPSVLLYELDNHIGGVDAVVVLRVPPVRVVLGVGVEALPHSLTRFLALLPIREKQTRKRVSCCAVCVELRS